jgi:hypothetical protein
MVEGIGQKPETICELGNGSYSQVIHNLLQDNNL